MGDETLETIIEGKPDQADCRIVAVIPAYNEDRFIGSVVLKVSEYVHDVIVVDDGSNDRTKDVAEAAGAFVERHSTNRGKGIALNSGFKKARELNPDAVVVLDADGQHNPAEIPGLVIRVLSCRQRNHSCRWCLNQFRGESTGPDKVSLDALPKADIAIGSRYMEKISEVPRHRVFGHRLFNWLTRFTSGVSSTDSQSGFRAFSAKALEVLSFSSAGFSVESEMQMIAKEHNLKVLEAPITVIYEEPPKRNVLQHGLQVLNGVLRLTGQYRPLLFFGVPGVILLILGLAWGWFVVDIYRRVQELAVGYTMLSLLLSIAGLVLLSTGIILHSVRGLLIDMLRDKTINLE